MSNAADPTAAFLAALQASRLLAEPQLHDIRGWSAQHRPDVPGLAKEINRRGWLTVYQIKEIARGRGAGLLLGHYIVQDLLGEGGMGRVYKAHNTRLGRDEALKVIRADKLKHPSALARFTSEMQALGKVKHPNVVTAFDAGPLNDSHFVSMELIDGIDLTRMVRDRGPMPFPFACECIRQSALGLQHASELGMVHRDIKPSNILVSRDGKHVKLVDLGLARLNEPIQEGANRVTQEGFVIGTPDFLAPEQARNPAGVDIRADIYALGATLFFILTGRVPYDGANATEKLLKHCTEPPPSLLQHRPDVPPQLEQLMHWCMAKRPEDRPQSPLQLALALQPFCPAPPPGTGTHRVAPPSGLFPPVVLNDPNSSSQVFKLPSQSNDTDPIRRRAKAGFPWSFVLLSFGALLLAGIIAYAAYRALQPTVLPPVETFTNTSDMKMLKIEGGTFEMGSPAKEPGRAAPKPRQPDDEAPVHTVTIRGPFLMSATEVTHNQYMKVMGTGPAQSAVVRRAKDPSNHPVEFVSYEDALEFCKRLTEKEAEKKQPYLRPGWAYRLPTEAEWEFCCRAGTTTPFHFGDKMNNIPKLGGETQPGGRYLPTGDEKEQELEGGNVVKDAAIEDIPGLVAQYRANDWGLFDMHGNAAEWCLDWYHRSYLPGDPRDNPTGPPTGERRVIRGGSFRDPASACRSAARTALSPTEKRATIGFRVVYAPVIK